MELASKITNIFCIADDFCKEFEAQTQRNTLESETQDQHHSQARGKRRPRISEAEMMTILILFHSNTFRNVKHFYLFYVCKHLSKEFPNLVSYSRFVELMPRVGPHCYCFSSSF